jgi:ubiquinone/menaquinone biosynthesis C-methylase UbiE
MFSYHIKYNMEYEDYNKTSQVYENTRCPVGIEIIKMLMNMSNNQNPLSEKHLLDVGCGSGQYLNQLSKLFKSSIGIDQNDGMLAKLKERNLENVTVIKGSLNDKLEVDSNSRDIILTTQVLHHIAKENVIKLSGELYRVLTDDGVLIINMTLPHQNIDGYWYMDLIPDAVKKLNEKTFELSEYKEMFKEFEYLGCYMNTNERLQGSAYNQYERVFDENWRAGDSTWALATEDELKSGLEKCREMIANDEEWTKWINERERKREQVGQSVYICFRKSN